MAELYARGWTFARVGKELFISPKTVDKHIENIYAKTGGRCRLVKFAFWIPWLGAILAGYYETERVELNPWFFFETRVSVDEPTGRSPGFVIFPG